MVHECLAEWENILSNGFLYTNPRNLFYWAQLVRISMPYVKWVKIRDIFWYVMRMRSVPVKMTRFLHFWDSIFRKQSLILRKRLKIRVCGLFCSAHKILLNIPMYFLPANTPQFLNHSCTSEQFWRKYGNFENRKISTLSKKIKKLANGLKHTLIILYTIFIFLTASF